jgi:hypothetical protein
MASAIAAASVRHRVLRSAAASADRRHAAELAVADNA